MNQRQDQLNQQALRFWAVPVPPRARGTRQARVSWTTRARGTHQARVSWTTRARARARRVRARAQPFPHAVMVMLIQRRVATKGLEITTMEPARLIAPFRFVEMDSSSLENLATTATIFCRMLAPRVASSTSAEMVSSIQGLKPVTVPTYPIKSAMLIAPRHGVVMGYSTWLRERFVMMGTYPTLICAPRNAHQNPVVMGSSNGVRTARMETFLMGTGVPQAASKKTSNAR